MKTEQRLVVYDLTFAITACDFGIFPDVEYLVWLRSIPRRSKALVIKAAEDVPVWLRKADSRLLERSYTAREYSVSERRKDTVVALLSDLGLPKRTPDVEGEFDVDLSWWVVADLKLSVNWESEGSLSLNVAGGISGKDAPAFVELVQQLIQIGDDAQTPWWEKLLLSRED